VEALGVGLGEQVQVGVLGQVGGQADDLGAVRGQLDQGLAEGRGLDALPFEAIEAIIADVVRRGFFSATGLFMRGSFGLRLVQDLPAPAATRAGRRG
jgi:hypothetical protein